MVHCDNCGLCVMSRSIAILNSYQTQLATSRTYAGLLPSVIATYSHTTYSPSKHLWILLIQENVRCTVHVVLINIHFNACLVKEFIQYSLPFLKETVLRVGQGWGKALSNSLSLKHKYLNVFKHKHKHKYYPGIHDLS